MALETTFFFPHVVLVLLYALAKITGFAYVYRWAFGASDPINNTRKFATRKAAFHIHQLIAQLARRCVRQLQIVLSENTCQGLTDSRYIWHHGAFWLLCVLACYIFLE